MGLYKIFKDIFYDTMTSRGFIHQKNVFLRINGEVLQAVTVKPIVGYEITCAVFPLFASKDLCADFRDHNLGENYSLGSKPYWAELYSMRFDGYKGFPYRVEPYPMIEGFMNKEPFLSMTVANLEKAAELMPHMYIDRFDGVTDLNSFLNWYCTPEVVSNVRTHYRLPWRVLCAKAYYDGNFEYGKNYIETRYNSMRQEVIDNKNGWYISLDENLARIDELFSSSYGDFFEYEKKNDLPWVPSYVENGKKETLNILKINYPKLFK